MTNKPMLSVERELLERLTENWNGTDARIELRALLDKPACIKCKDTGEADSGGVQPWGEGINIPCDCVLAAKQQGEPVAICRLWNEGGSGERASIEWIGDPCADGALLYVEQPAPVSPAPKCEPCNGKGSISDDDGIDMGICNFCDGSGAKPIAIILPERMVKTDRSSDEYNMCADAHNDCLDTVARLNGVKP